MVGGDASNFYHRYAFIPGRVIINGVVGMATHNFLPLAGAPQWTIAGYKKFKKKVLLTLCRVLDIKKNT